MKEFRVDGLLYLQVHQDSSLFIMTMSTEENRFGTHMVAAFNSALDYIETQVAVLGQAKSSALITIGNGKFYSNGLNLSEFLSGDQSSRQADFPNLIKFLDSEFLPLLGRLLTFPIPTIALVNGHCYAGGFLLALAHDYRIGQKQLGYYCMNEIRIGLPMHPSMMALLQAKLYRESIIRAALLTAKRWTAAEALEDDIIDKAVETVDILLSEGKAFARKITALNYGGSNYSSMKETMYAAAFRALKRGEKLGNL